MTLTETLQLKERFLKLEDMRALDYCERRWKEEGCPAERWQVIITPSTKLMTLFNWRRIGRGVRKNSSSPPWASPA